MRVLVLSFCLALIGSARAGDELKANETAAANCCKAFAEAEEIYHRTDYQGAGILQYAQCLHGGREAPPAPPIDPSKAPKPTEEEKKTIAKLISAMQDDDFAAREKAFNELKALGAKAYDQLVAGQKLEKDPEVIQRCKKLAQAVNDALTPRPKIDMKYGLLGSGQDELALIDKSFGEAECAAGADPAKITPKAGYLFRVLTRQGPAAVGSKRDYIIEGHMTLGYALLAFPKEYGVTGGKCFMINGNGTIFERDFGSKEKTEAFAKDCIEFNPEIEWKPTE